MEILGRWLLLLGVLLVMIGVAFILLSKFSFKLPGDIHIQGKNYTIYIPIATSIILSLVLTLILNIILFLKR